MSKADTLAELVAAAEDALRCANRSTGRLPGNVRRRLREAVDAAARLRPILADMLAYEAERFDAVPLAFYVQHPKWTRGPYDDRETAEATAAAYPGAHVSEEFGDLDVSGADLVDAFSEWRAQLREVLNHG